MSSNVLIFLEMSLVLGGALTLVVWQLVALKRERRRREQRAAAPPDPDGSAERPRQTER